MYVCLCTGATTQAVADAVASSATTCNQVAAHCDAGLDCGRCRRTVQAIIAAERPRGCPEREVVSSSGRG